MIFTNDLRLKLEAIDKNDFDGRQLNFKMALSKTSKTLLIIGGILFVFLLIGIIGIALLAESYGKPTVADNSVLVLSVSGDLPDYVAGRAARQSFWYQAEAVVSRAC